VIRFVSSWLMPSLMDFCPLAVNGLLSATHKRGC
jgi:hypothetical protein